jgi:hypothetical protein
VVYEYIYKLNFGNFLMAASQKRMFYLKTSVFDLEVLFLTRLYSKVWPMLSIFDSNKQKTPLEISVVFDRWGAVL